MNRTVRLLIGGALVLFGVSDVLAGFSSASVASLVWGAALVILGATLLARSKEPVPPES